jgi:hypothetical protein
LLIEVLHHHLVYLANQALLLVTQLGAKLSERGCSGVATAAKEIEIRIYTKGKDNGLEKDCWCDFCSALAALRDAILVVYKLF